MPKGAGIGFGVRKTASKPARGAAKPKAAKSRSSRKKRS